MVWDQDWLNLTIDKSIAWDCESSCTLDLDEELEHWLNQLHEVFMLHYNMMKTSLRCVSSEVRNWPYYDGLIEVDRLWDAFEREVPEKHHLEALDWVLHATLARSWGTHKDNFNDWCKLSMACWMHNRQFSFRISLCCHPSSKIIDVHIFLEIIKLIRWMTLLFQFGEKTEIVISAFWFIMNFSTLGCPCNPSGLLKICNYFTSLKFPNSWNHSACCLSNSWLLRVLVLPILSWLKVWENGFGSILSLFLRLWKSQG